MKAILQSTYRFRCRDCPTSSVGRVESAFPQWDKLTSLLRGMARQSAADYAQRNIVRIISKNGIAHLANYAANLLAVEGGTTTIIMPDMTPGKREISAFDGTASVAFHKVARMAKSYWRYLRETS